MKEKFKIALIGSGISLRNSICNKISKFFNLPIISDEKLFKNINPLDNDYYNKIRFNLSLINDKYDSFILNNIYIDEDLYECIPIDLMIYFNINSNELKNNNSQIRWCPTCFRIYHLIKNKPLKDNLCDRCGSKIILRKKDDVKNIDNLLNDWEYLSFSLRNFYDGKKKLLNIFEDKDENIDQITSKIIKMINKKDK